MLYLSNTVGAVCGSLGGRLPAAAAARIQGSATVLTIAAGLGRLSPLVSRIRRRGVGALVRHRGARSRSTLVGGLALALWLLLPSDYVCRGRSASAEGERLLTLSEGVDRGHRGDRDAATGGDGC